MNPLIIGAIDAAFGLLEQLLSKNKNQLPTELVTAAQKAVDAWAEHRDDLITKANLEAQRGL